MFLLALLLAQAIPAPPPGYTPDKPWEHDKIVGTINPFDRFDPKEPYILIVSSVAGQSITRIDYTSGGRCERARLEILRQVGTPTADNRVSTPVVAFCIPR